MDSTYTSGLGTSLLWLLRWESDRLTFGAGTSLCSHLISAVNLRSCSASRAGWLTQLSCRLPVSRGSRSWLVLLLAPSLPRWNTGHIRDAGPRPNMRTRTPHFFLPRTQRLLAAHLAFWREEEPSAAAYLQDEQWVAAIVLVGSSIDHK